MNRRSWGFAIALVMLAVVPNALFGQARLASRFGEANVGGQRVIVHVTVAVPPGADENAVAEDALRGQGARPIQPAEFAVTGLVWDQFFNGSAGDNQVLQYYNPAGEPVAAHSILMDTQASWSITESIFSFDDEGITGRCPSLVLECPGPQSFDGFNDVGWANIGGCCTLGVTWYSTSIDEADMALNTRFSWSTDGSDFDIETVFLHENGHVVGLDHSTVSGSVMEAVYSSALTDLQEDDRRGVAYLYPNPTWVGEISGTVKALSTGLPIAGAKVSIADFPAAANATTDSDGNYTSAGIPDIGDYSVIASAGGYQSQTIEGVTVPDATVDFSLGATSGGGGGGGGAEKGPKKCSDGIDNDGDGAIDGADSDCTGF